MTTQSSTNSATFSRRNFSGLWIRRKRIYLVEYLAERLLLRAI